MTSLRVTRRELVALGAAAAALPTFAPWARAEDFFAVAARAAGKLSVGYLGGSERHGDLRLLPWETPGSGTGGGTAAAAGRPRIVPAGRMALGDLSLAGGESVRLRVHGIYPSVAWSDDSLLHAALFVRFPEPEPGVGPLRVLAWELRRLPAYSPSPPLSQVVPLGINGELELGVESQRVGEAEPLERWATFTVDSVSGAPKLKRGFYFLGVDAATWSAPVAVPAQRQSMRADLRSIVVSIDPIRAPAD
jgi:hypothetical protein